MAITFACPGCGKHFKVDDEKAGRKGKCPSCATVFDIPKRGETAGVTKTAPTPPRRPTPVLHEEDERDEPRRPRAEAPRRRPADDEDEEDRRPARRPRDEERAEYEYEEEERPRRRKKKKKQKSATGLIIGLVGGALLLFLLIGGVVWAVVRMSGSNTVEDDLKYLPEGAEQLIVVNADALTGSELYKRLKQETTVLNNVSPAAQGDLALELTDFQRVTVGTLQAGGATITVIRTKKAINFDELLAKNPKLYNQEEEYGRYKVRHDAFTALCIPERKTLVIGPCLVLKKVLERGTKATLAPGLQTIYGELDFGKSIVFAGDTRNAAAGPPPGQFPQPGPGNPLAPFLNAGQGPVPDGVIATLDVGTNVTANIIAICKSAADAEQSKKQLDGLQGMLKLIPGVPPEVSDILRNLQATINGNRLTVSLSLDNNTIVDLVKKFAGGR